MTSYCVNEGNDTFNKDGTADEGEEEEDNHDNSYFVLAFLSMLSENRTRSAAFREVNQAARRGHCSVLLCAYLTLHFYL